MQALLQIIASDHGRRGVNTAHSLWRYAVCLCPFNGMCDDWNGRGVVIAQACRSYEWHLGAEALGHTCNFGIVCGHEHVFKAATLSCGLDGPGDHGVHRRRRGLHHPARGRDGAFQHEVLGEAEILEDLVIAAHEDARKKAEGELKKLKLMSPMSAEATVVRNYLDWLLGIPWGQNSKVKKDLKFAEGVLDSDHYGLDKVKERIVEYLAVQARSDKLKGPILCLLGPPGVGKPSLAAIVPLSVIGNTATTLVPGGILNSGFALAWIEHVYDRAAPYGQGWEQGRRKPDIAARILLKTIEISPEAVERAVRSA